MAQFNRKFKRVNSIVISYMYCYCQGGSNSFCQCLKENFKCKPISTQKKFASFQSCKQRRFPDNGFSLRQREKKREKSQRTQFKAQEGQSDFQAKIQSSLRLSQTLNSFCLIPSNKPFAYYKCLVCAIQLTHMNKQKGVTYLWGLTASPSRA